MSGGNGLPTGYGSQAQLSATGGIDKGNVPPVETSSYGRVLPVFYGTIRIPGQISSMPNFMWTKLGANASAGKGGADTGGPNVYTQGVTIAIAEGMTDRFGASQVTIGRMWADKEVYATYNTPIEMGDTQQRFSSFSLLPGNRQLPGNSAYSVAPWTGWFGGFSWVVISVPATVPGAGGPYTILITDLNYSANQTNGNLLPGAGYGVYMNTGYNHGGYIKLGADFTGVVTGSVLTVSGYDSFVGAVTVGHALYNSAGAYLGATISSFGTGSGGNGTYNLSASIGPLASQHMKTGDYTVTGVIGNIVYTFIAAAAASTVNINYDMNANGGLYDIPYGGTVYVACGALPLGSSNSMKNYSFEAINNHTTLDGNGNAAVSDILQDMIPNNAYGMNFNYYLETKIGQDGTTASGLAAYCAAVGIALSPLFDSQKNAIEWVQWILDASNCEAVWTQGIWRFFPRGDVAVGAFTPYVSAIYSVNEDNMLADEGEDMIDVVRKKQTEIVNCCPVEYTDSKIADQDSQYQTAVAQDYEEPNIQISGGVARADSTRSLKCITLNPIAVYIARVNAQRSIYIRNTYKFRLPQQFSLLDPFDLIAISDSTAGISNLLCRIITIEESNEHEDLEIEAEEAGLGASHTVVYTPGTPQGGGQRLQLPPTFPVSPIMWSPPGAASGGLLGGTNYYGGGKFGGVSPQATFSPRKKAGNTGVQPELWVATAGAGNTNWGGAAVYVSFDGTTYEYVSDIGASTFGTLGASFVKGAPIDSSNTATVDLSLSRGTLGSVTTADRDAFTSVCLVDGELIAYQTATLTGTNTYALTNHRRGLYGTPVTTHAVGSQFLKIDENVLRIPLDQSRYGATIYVKICSYNQAKSVQQPLSTAQVFTYTLPSAGASGANTVSVIESLPLRITFDNYDATQWDFPISSGNLSVLFLPGTVLTGGLCLRCDTGPVMMVQRALIPYDQDKIYQIEAVVIQESGATPRTIYVGFVGVSSDGVTQVDINGSSNPAIPSVQHYVSWIDAGSTYQWTKITGYYHFRGTFGSAPASPNPFSPSAPQRGVCYLRPFICFNKDPDGAAVQDINYIRITELISPYQSTARYADQLCTLSGTTTNPNDTWLVPVNYSTPWTIENVTDGGLTIPASSYTYTAATGLIVFAANAIPQSEVVTCTTNEPLPLI